MIKLTDKDKTLVVPAGLGNFGQSSGSGGGVTPEEAAQIASAVTAEALYEYDTELQVDLEEIREAVSANTGTLLDLSQIAVMTVADRVALFDEIYDKADSGEKVYIKGLVQEETIRTAILPLVSYRPETNPILHQGGYLYFAAKGDTDNIYFHVALSSEGAIDPTSSTFIKRNIYTLPTASSEVKGGVKVGSGLLMTQDTLSLDTTGIVTDGDLAPFIVQLSGNTEDIAAISGQTTANTQDIGILSGQTTANTADIAELSGVTEAIEGNLETVSGKAGEVYDAIFYEEEGETHSEISDLWDALDEKQDMLEAGSGISINDNVVSINPPGRAISLSETGRLQLNLGSGVTIGEDNELNLKIGEGLGFSGDTLVVSGVSSGPTEYFLNNMSQQELAALYAEISGITEGVSDSANIPEILSNYKFFIATETDGQKWSEAFFSNWEGVWDDELQEHIQALWITTLKPPKPSYSCGVMRSWAQIKPNGSVEFNSDSFEASSVESASNDITIPLNSAGTITNTDNLGAFSSLAKFSKIWFAYNDENVQNSWNTAPLSYFYRKQVGDDLMEYFGCTINIDGTFYKGTWSTPEWGWSGELAADTWTTV